MVFYYILIIAGFAFAVAAFRKANAVIRDNAELRRQLDDVWNRLQALERSPPLPERPRPGATTGDRSVDARHTGEVAAEPTGLAPALMPEKAYEEARREPVVPEPLISEPPLPESSVTRSVSVPTIKVTEELHPAPAAPGLQPLADLGLQPVATAETATDEGAIAAKPDPVAPAAPPVLPELAYSDASVPESPGPSVPAAAAAADASTTVEDTGNDAERAFATKWTVWIGGVALAMGGLLIVRYSIEAGFFGPRVRLAMGAAFALAMAVASEVLRRRDLRLDVRASFADQIPAVLAGVSVLSAFGVVYAAHAVYELIGAGPAFAMMGIIGLSALAASLLHGPKLGLFGLLGSYLTPIMVSGVAPSYTALSIFIAIVTSAAFLLDLRRSSPALVGGAVLGHAIWTCLISLGAETSAWGDCLLIVAVVLATVHVEAGARTRQVGSAEVGSAELGRPVTTVAFAAFAVPLVLAGFLWVEHGGGLATRLVLVVIVGCNIVAAIRHGGLAALAPLAAAGATGMILLWPSSDGPLRVTARLVLDVLRLDLVPNAAPGLALFASSLGAVVVVPLLASLLALWRNAATGPVSRGCLAVASALAPVCMMLAASLRLNGFNRTTGFAVIAAILALALAVISEVMYLRERARAESPADPLSFIGSAMHAAAGAIAVGLAIAFALRETWLVVGFAIASMGVAMIAIARPIPLLRTIAAALGTAALARMIWQPILVDIGELPFLNWLLVGYGVPALAFIAAAWALAPRRDRALATVEALAAIFLTAVVGLELVQAVVGGDLRQASPLLRELVSPFHYDADLMRAAGRANAMTALVAALTVAAALLATLFMMLKGMARSWVFAKAELCLSTAAVVAAVAGLGIFLNPILNGVPVQESPILNRLLLGYLGSAAVLAGLAIVLARRGGDRRLQAVLESLAIILGVLGAVLVMRHWFTGPVMSMRSPASVGFYESVSTTLLLLLSAAVVAMWRDRSGSRVLHGGVVGIVGVAIGYAAVMLGVARNPLRDGSLVEGPILFNRILWGYAPVAVGFAMLARMVGRTAPRSCTVLLGASATATYLMAVLLIRHGFHGATLFSGLPITLAEAGLYGGLALTAAFLGSRLYRAPDTLSDGEARSVWLASAAVALHVVVLLVAVLGGARLAGWWLLNNAVPALLLPAALATALSWRCRSVGCRPLTAQVYAAAAIAACAVYVLLQVRFAFHGVTLVSDLPMTLAEAGIYGALALVAACLVSRFQHARARMSEREPSHVGIGVLAVGVHIVVLAIALDGGARLNGWPFLNNSIPALLLPAVVAAVASLWCQLAGLTHRVARFYLGTAVAGALTYVLVQARFIFHGVTLVSDLPVTLAEAGTYGSLALIAALTASRALDRRSASPGTDRLLRWWALLGVGVPAIFLGIAAAHRVPLVGWPLLNNAMLGVLAPTILAAICSLWSRCRGRPVDIARIYGAAAVLGGLIFVLLQVRSALPATDTLEDLLSGSHELRLFGYSLAIIGYGLALLVAGLRMAYRDLRVAALAVVGLAVCKVFLLDLGGLEGLWRATSFIGLGVCLIGIAYLYRWLEPGGANARRAETTTGARQPPAAARPQA